MSESEELQEGQFHPDNPVFARKPQPHCNECGGRHEPSGAWRDCLNYWKLVAGVNFELVTIAQNLLSSATPNSKLLTDSEQEQWANGFGKWWARAYPRPDIANVNTLSLGLLHWLNQGKYRIVMHRHNDTFRAIDQAEFLFCDRDNLEDLCSALEDWKHNGKSTHDQYYNLSQV